MPNRTLITAQEIYDKLMNEDRITDLNGYIKFNLGDYVMTVKSKDVVGSILEGWLKTWLDAHNAYYLANPSTQKKPDIFLIPDNTKDGLLEIKAFDRTKSPNFDLGDFKGFATEVISKPYLLDIDTLIFGYNMNEQTGEVIVKNLWLRKIWALSRPMDTWPINVQYKNRIISKMRPATWYSERSQFRTFDTKEDFLSAFEETLYRYADTHSMASDWKFRFQRSYRNHYGTDINIPRWDDIKERYSL